MKNYKYLIFDLDETLLDFRSAEKKALQHIFEEYNIPFNNENYTTYKDINRVLWSQLEKQEISKSDVLEKRFERFFNTFNCQVNGQLVDKEFRQQLTVGNQLFPKAKETLEFLQSHNYILLAGTNGVGVTQRKRLKNADIDYVFDNIFISEEIGYAKPSPLFYKAIFNCYPDMNHTNTLMIGDSLTSDIQGAINIGIDSIWINPNPENIDNVGATFIIQSIDEIIQFDFI